MQISRVRKGPPSSPSLTEGVLAMHRGGGDPGYYLRQFVLPHLIAASKGGLYHAVCDAMTSQGSRVIRCRTLWARGSPSAYVVHYWDRVGNRRSIVLDRTKLQRTIPQLSNVLVPGWPFDDPTAFSYRFNMDVFPFLDFKGVINSSSVDYFRTMFAPFVRRPLRSRLIRHHPTTKSLYDWALWLGDLFVSHPSDYRQDPHPIDWLYDLLQLITSQSPRVARDNGDLNLVLLFRSTQCAKCFVRSSGWQANASEMVAYFLNLMRQFIHRTARRSAHHHLVMSYSLGNVDVCVPSHISRGQSAYLVILAHYVQDATRLISVDTHVPEQLLAMGTVQSQLASKFVLGVCGRGLGAVRDGRHWRVQGPYGTYETKIFSYHPSWDRLTSRGVTRATTRVRRPNCSINFERSDSRSCRYVFSAIRASSDLIPDFRQIYCGCLTCGALISDTMGCYYSDWFKPLSLRPHVGHTLWHPYGRHVVTVLDALDVVDHRSFYWGVVRGANRSSVPVTLEGGINKRYSSFLPN